jgi:hypothetical protein
VVLPTLVNGKTVELLETNSNNEAATDVEVNEDLLNSDSLEAATDAAISAISSVAASKNKSFKSADSSGSRSISKSSLNGILPVSSLAGSKYASTNLADSDASSNINLNTDDLMSFKQEPSTSSDKSGSPSNMILACTGNSSEDNCIDRCAFLHTKTSFICINTFF